MVKQYFVIFRWVLVYDTELHSMVSETQSFDRGCDTLT